MANRIHIKIENHLRYNLKVWHKKCDFDILQNIIEYVTLVQLTDSLGNFNHAISIVWYWVFEYKYEKSLFLTQESLVVICSPSIVEEKVATFQSIFYAVKYIWAPINIKK